MATDTKPNRLDDSKQAWLGRVIGGKELFDDSTGLVPKDADGNVLDLAAIEAEVGEFQGEVEPEGLYALEIMEKRQLLMQFGIPSVAEAATEFDNKMETRDKALSEMRNLIELQKEEIRNATDYEVTVKRRLEIRGKEFLYGSKKVSTKTKSGGVRGINKKYDSMADEEFDSEHYKGRVLQGPSPEQKKALELVITQLELLTKKLQNNEGYDFTPQELMNEMWTPLVREGLVSEDQCPQEFSRVTKLFQGASALYNKRLEAEARKEVDQLADVRNHLDDVSEALGIGASVADLILSLVGGQGQAQEIIKLATQCTQGSIKTASALMEKKANMQDAASSVGGVMEAVIGAAVGGKQGKEIGKMAKAGFTGAVSLGLFAKKIAERNYDDGYELLADAVENALSCIGDATGNDKISEASSHIGQAMKTSKDLAKMTYLLSQSPVDQDAVKALMAKIVTEAVKKGIDLGIDKGEHAKIVEGKEEELERIKNEKGEDHKDYKEAEAALDKLKEDQEKMREDVGTIFDDLVKGGTESITELTKKVELAAIEKGADQAEAELAAENDVFNKRLGIAFGMSIGADESDEALLEDLYSIDALIAQIQKDRAMLQLFNVIFDAVGSVVTLIIPQLGGPLKAKAFAMNVVAATQRSADLICFTALVDDARKATSPQGPALLAEVDELKRHLSNDTMEAAIALGQAISLSVAAGGDIATAAMGTGAIASTVGRAVNSGLDAFKKSKDLLNKKFAEKKTRRAWDMYKKALANPRDRRLVLKTFRANPTLAKYCIAYGALEMDDPIARETLRQVGLNDMTLAQENSNADKVVQFLEVKFADDIIVEGIVSQFAPDLGDPLTISIWVKNKEAAASPKNPADEQWKTEKTNAIDAAMIKVEDLTDQVAKNDLARVYKLEEWSSTHAIWKEYIASLAQLQAALLIFKPLSENGQPFKRFQQYVLELNRLAQRKIDEAEETIASQLDLLKSRKNLCELTSTNALKAAQQIHTAVPKLGKPEDNQTPEQLIELFASGEVSKLMQQIAELSTETPNLVPHTELLKHAIDFASRSAARALTTAEKDPTKATVLAADCMRTLLTEIETARTSFNAEAQRSATELTTYPKLAS